MSEPDGYVWDMSAPTTAFIPISREMGLDLGWWPWLSPDRNPMPHIVAVPWLDTLTNGYHEARRRIRAAVHILRHGEDEDDDWEAGYW